MYFASFRFRKVFKIVALMIAMAIGWWAFGQRQYYFTNLEPYHLKSYAFLAVSWLSSFHSIQAADLTGERDARAIPVLTYHGILDGRGPADSATTTGEGINVSIDVFKDQMVSLKKAGYQTITLAQLYAFMRDQIPLPDKSFVLTFDDGRKDSFYPVDPILAALDYHAVMFAITKHMFEEGSSYYLTLEELQAMERSGRWEIQSHGKDAHEFYAVNAARGMGHFMSNKLWKMGEARAETTEEFMARIKRDLVASKIDIASHFSLPVTGYAFPYGDFGQVSENFPEAEDLVPMAASQVYPLLFYQTSYHGSRFTANYNDRPKDESFFITRIGVESGWSGARLLKELEESRAKSLPFEAALLGEDGWIRGWGDVGMESHTMVMRPVKGETGSMAILDGTRHWRQYDYRAKVQRTSGSTISLYARFLDDDNFVGCNFGNDAYYLDQTLQGERKTIKTVERRAHYPEDEFEIGVRVLGSRAECLVDDVIVADTELLSPELSSGGIGLKVWNAIPDIAELRVTGITVSNLEEVRMPFLDDFNAEVVLEETPYPHQSTHPFWWLNSGGEFHIADGIGRTLQGNEATTRWQEEYAATNPVDSDQGTHPQNIFRLVFKGKERDVRTEAQFRIRGTQVSASPERIQSNGVLLLLRYLDENTLYYAGLRVDGQAVIKKKTKDFGYRTLAMQQFYPGHYNRLNNPTLLPVDTWIGLRAEARNGADGAVTITLFTEQQGSGEWVKTLEGRDDGMRFGGPAITEPGHVGIRSDFMDVEFDKVKVTHL